MNISQIHLAPMVGRTDFFFRALIRILSKEINLYTEMITCDTFIHTDRKDYKVHPEEHFIAIQLAGSKPEMFSKCASMVKDNHYDEININVGCPSSKVVKGEFGACLMKSPDLLAEIIQSIKSQVDLPVSIKTRLGLDYDEDLSLLIELIDKTSKAGCSKFIIHARNAILGGMSPKKNRSIPSIRYHDALQIKNKYPHLQFILNGEINDLETIGTYIETFDGLMIGRKIYDDPMFLQNIYRGSNDMPKLSRTEVLDMYLQTISPHMKGKSNYILLRHLFGLHYNTPSSKKWKKLLHEVIQEEQSINRLLEFKEN